MNYRYTIIILAMLLVMPIVGCGSQTSSAPSAPSTPTNVTATPVGTNGDVTISWSEVPGATSYNIYWSTLTGVTPANGNKISVTTNTYTQIALGSAATYYYLVTAVNGNGESPATTQVSVIPVVTQLAAPTNFTATPGNSQITLTWTAVPGATSYFIWVSFPITPPIIANSGLNDHITVVNSPYTMTGLTNGTNYTFSISAVNANNASTNIQASATPF